MHPPNHVPPPPPLSSDRGFWVNLEHYESDDIQDSLETHACVAEEQCPSNSPPSCYEYERIERALEGVADDDSDCLHLDSPCKQGATGPLCDVCEKGFFHGGGGYCEACERAGSAGGLAVFIVVMILLAVVFLAVAYVFAKPVYDYWDAKLAIWFDVGKVKVLVSGERM